MMCCSRTRCKSFGKRANGLFGLHDGVHRFYASRTLGFTHVPAEVMDLNF